jgi:amino acid transporter
MGNALSFRGGESIVSSRFYLVLICAVVVLFAAFMNYREAVSASWTNYLMFIGAIGMFVCAGLLYRSEKL